jgi:hypothetical protein
MAFLAGLKIRASMIGLPLTVLPEHYGQDYG